MGELAALTCALLWAIAARIFRNLGGEFSSVALNFWKGLISILLLIVVVQFIPMEFELSNQVIFWLALSGIIGIGIGDTFFFLALKKIGDSQSILIAETLAPIGTALLAMAWIGEWLSWQQWLGIAVVIISVDIIIKIQKRNSERAFELTGYGYAAIAALCQSIGAVVSRDVLLSSDIDVFHASLIRLLGGMAIILVLILIGRRTLLPKTKQQPSIWLWLLAATFIGTFMALVLQMVAFSYTKAAVVQTLFAVSVIISLAIARLLGEKVRRNTLLWSFFALVGVGVLLFAP
ncbi:MAG: DMT family transporter [Enterobacterales bacterium]|nr:DMT family transporter [Enterobacterales bacterium]